MAAQMKQLEQRLMALRAELRDKENKARQAEGSVQDLKLQLNDLQVCANTKAAAACAAIASDCLRLGDPGMSNSQPPLLCCLD